MFILDRLLHLFARVFVVSNQRRSTLFVLVFGGLAAAYLLRGIWLNQPFEIQVIALYSILMLPLLLYKAFLYFLLTLFDVVVMFFADYSCRYEIDYERVRSRVIAILTEKNVRYQSLENLALGGERGLLRFLRNLLRLNYPLIFVCADRPFLVVKIFRVFRPPKLENLRRQITPLETIHVAVFHGEEQEARVVAKLIVNSLEILNKEQVQNALQERLPDAISAAKEE